MDSEKSQGSVLKAVLQAKDSNRIQGIYGRMGDLGAIDGECNFLSRLVLIAVLFFTLQIPHGNKSSYFNG